MNVFLLVLILMAIYISFKNYSVLKRHKSFKAYMPLIDPVYNDNDEEFLKLVDAYIESEKLKDFQNKAKILKLFSLIKEDNPDYKGVLEDLDLNEIITDNKGKINKTKQMLNSDSYFWLLLTSIVADINKNEEALNAIKDKVHTYDDTLGNELYLKMVEAYLDVALGDKESLNLFKRVLEGDYYEFTYAKDLIAIFKRLAASILIYKGEEIGADDEALLTSFSKGQAGSFVLKQMGLYEKYSDDVIEEKE